jgi:hypothetical protein
LKTKRASEKEELGRWRLVHLPKIGLFAEKNRDDQRTFRKSGDEERLNENLTGCAWVTTYGFTSLKTDKTKSDGGTESGTCDSDVT